MLVRTVTAITSGGVRVRVVGGVSLRRVARRLHHLRPPEAWTLTIHTPSDVAAATALATVFGMSWNFRSRNTRSPWSDQRPNDRRSFGGEEPAADLEPAGDPAQRVRERRAPLRRSRRRAQSGADPRRVPSSSCRGCRSAWPGDSIPCACHVARGFRRAAVVQMNGSTKFAVPTWTAVAPAIMNSSTSSAVAIPPMPMIGSFTAWRHS